MNNNIIGVDEVGRGSLVGSVIVCAFKSSNIFFKNFPYEIKDSKKLSKLKRNLIYKELRKEKFNGSIDYKICFGKKREIELLNIHNTVLNSMNKAVNKIYKNGDRVIIDGSFIPEKLKQMDIEAIIKADDKFPQVSAASIVAKCFRDKLMTNLHKLDERFFWDKNSGYPTKKHLQSIKLNGISDFHRKTYQPISKFINNL
ncbi:MAG: ribonuclease HII [Pelagibacteraceae bacterium]|nr:ribonuclease HII [Pelagibacteraceae bacterium]|tara:strand:+ start:3371 stop:3970 length:600 start_codon:yes stop_codon:yes gene_type:complete